MGLKWTVEIELDDTLTSEGYGVDESSLERAILFDMFGVDLDNQRLSDWRQRPIKCKMLSAPSRTQIAAVRMTTTDER